MNAIDALTFDYPVNHPRHELAIREALLPGSTKGLKNADESIWGEDGFSFDDLIDFVNPLQQLPVVGNIYREITGDSIAPIARMVGGFLLGGPLGFFTAFAAAGLEEATGGDLAENFFSLFDGDSPSDRQYVNTQYGKITKLIPG